MCTLACPFASPKDLHWCACGMSRHFILRTHPSDLCRNRELHSVAKSTHPAPFRHLKPALRFVRASAPAPVLLLEVSPLSCALHLVGKIDKAEISLKFSVPCARCFSRFDVTTKQFAAARALAKHGNSQRTSRHAQGGSHLTLVILLRQDSRLPCSPFPKGIFTFSAAVAQR